MVAFFKRPVAEDTLDARIAVLSRRAQPLVNTSDPPVAPPSPAAPVPATGPGIARPAVLEIVPPAAPEIAPAAAPPLPTVVPASDLSEEDRFLLVREELLARLTAELRG